MVLSRADNYSVSDFEKARKIYTCYQAAKESVKVFFVWVPGRKISYYGTKATVVDVKTARHLKDICFWYTSGNTTSARSMIASLLKQWRIKHKCLKCVLAPLQTGSFYVGVSQWGLNSSDLLNSCFIVLVCYIAGIKVMFTETILSLRNLITIR